MTRVYRLTSGCWMPLHWAYAEPFEIDAERGVVIDARVPGAQVWESLDQAVRALAGEDMDGFYRAEDYPVMLILSVSKTRHAGGDWSFVRPEDIEKARSLDSRALLDAMLGAFDPPLQDDDELLEELSAWMEEDFDEATAALEAAVDSLSRPCRLRWIETLAEQDFLSVAMQRWPLLVE